MAKKLTRRLLVPFAAIFIGLALVAVGAIPINLSFAKDLLDLNRTRFNALYADDTLQDRISTHQDLATEMGKRTAIWAGDLQEVAVELQSGFGEAANELFFPAAEKAPAPGKKSAKKAKAA